MKIILISVLTLLCSQGAWASASGQFEHSNNPSAAFGSGQSCAACHSAATHTGYSASITKSGSSSFPRLNNGTSYSDLSFRLSRGSSGTQASGAGFGLSVSSGTLVAQGGQSTKVKTTADNGGTNDVSIGKEMVHSFKKTNSSNSYIWNYTWNTPSTVGNYTFYACGNPVNDTGTDADDGTVRCTSNTVLVNTAPTAINDTSISHNEDAGNKTISPLSNDTAGGTGDTKTLLGYCLQGTANASCTNTGNFNLGVPGTLSKSGNNIIYSPASHYNGIFTFEYRMRDSAGSTSNAEVTVAVSAQNDPPSITGVNTTLAYIEDDGARTLEASISLSDVDSSQLNRALVQFSNNYVAGEDVLAVTNCAGLSSCTFNAGTGLLTLSGVASLATYTTALQSISYTNTSQSPSDSTRTVRYQVRDSANASSGYDSMSITVTPSDDRPSISGADTTLAYTEGQGARVLENSVSISDLDSTQLNRAQIDLSTNHVSSEDVLAATNCAGLTCSFNAATGTLTISGSASLFAYETAIESVTYANSSQNPSTATRTVRYTVRDVTNTSSTADSMLISVGRIEDPAVFNNPVYNRIGVGTSSATSQTIIEDANLQLQFSATDPEAISTIYSLVSTTPVLGGAEPAITVSSAGLLSWTPDGTRASVQAVVGVNDNVGSSPDSTFSITLNVTGTNDAPVIAQGTSTVVNMDEDANPTAFNLNLNATDIDGDTITWSILSQASKGNAAVNGTGTSKAITYIPMPNQNGMDSFVVRATDNTDSSDITVNVNIAAQPDAPVITQGNSVLVNMSEDGAPVAFNLTLNATDPDAEVITWSIRSQANLGTAAAGGTGSSKSIAYVANPNVSGQDSFVVRVTDSTGRRDDITVNINISPVNDAPTLSPIPGQSTDEYTPQNATSALQLNVSGSDIDGHSLSFSLDPASIAAGVAIRSINSTTAQISYLPQTGQDDLTNVMVTVTDNQQVYSPAISRSFAIVVNEVNDQPVLTPIGDTSVTELSSLQINMQVSDEDDTTAGLSFSLDAASIALGMSVDSNGQITWLPGENTVTTGSTNNFNVSASVQDGLQQGSAPQTSSFTVTVNKLDTDADGIADYNDVCPNVSDPGQADNDSDWVRAVANTATTGGDLCDADDDNDTMLDSYEMAHGLDPFDAADAALDNDRDGLTNAQEAALGSDPNADGVPPVITASTINVDASGVLTAVTFAATATDALDGAVSLSTSSHTGPFLSGAHTVTWQASDRVGNIATLDQNIYINPLVSVAASQLSGEGRTLNVNMQLSGPAVIYPVVVDYLIAGSASQPADHNLVAGSVSIPSGTQASLPVSIANDGLVEGNEEIIFSLNTATNAVIGTQSIQTITIVEQQVSPRFSLAATQNTHATVYIYKDQGVVSITAQASDANGDALSYDWSGVSGINFQPAPTPTSSTVQFDPSTLASGLYAIPVNVSDGSNIVSSSINLLLQSTTPTLTNTDSDGDGLDDIAEGIADSDFDYLPDYLDTMTHDNLISTYTSSLENNYLNALQTEAGLRLKLGRSAIAAMASGVQISVQDIQQASATPIPADLEYTPVSSLFDFEVHGLNDIKKTAKIIIPLPLRLPANAVYRKYTRATGWANFVSDTDNAVKSSYSNNGLCPNIMDSTYTVGLQLLADCIELTISDGGPNDADGLANGIIVDPGGIAIPRSTTPDALTEADLAAQQARNNAVSAGGSSAFNVIFLCLLVLISLYPVVRKNAKNH